MKLWRTTEEAIHTNIFIMKLGYVTSARLPTERAHGTQIVKMCEAFALAGASVSLITPNKKSNVYEDDIWHYYNVQQNFNFERLSSFDFLGKTLKFGRIFYWIDTVSFIISLFFTDLIQEGDVVYTRDPLLLLPFSPNKHKLCIEIHDIPRRKNIFLKMLRRAHKIIALNDIVKEELVALGITESKIMSAVDGVDLSEFDIALGHTDARRELGLPIEAKIVLYTGHLYSWKGAHTLAEAAKKLPPQVLCVFVGGVDNELEAFTRAFSHVPNIKVVPFQKREMVPIYLKAADLLVIPNSAKTAISAKYTSPLKLFEYMASKRPIVSSDLPSMRQVLTDANCFFAEADNPEALAAAIETALTDLSAAQIKMGQAFEDVKDYTWRRRGERIFNFISK
jgi:glycosyltransferase involved in cell wall biosynthesis